MPSDKFSDFPNWRPIDTAPKDGTDILLFIPRYGSPVQIGSYIVSEHIRNGKREWFNEGWHVNSGFSLPGNEPQPSHWLPLPVRPSSRDAEYAVACDGAI